MRISGMHALAALGLPLLLAAAGGPALAQPVAPGPGAAAPPGAPEARQAVPGGQSDQVEPYGGPVWQRSALLGDPGGARSRLAARGVTFGLLEQAEVLGNPTGGTRQGAVFEGLLTVSAGLDTGKAGLWPGGTFNASAYQIHGRGLSLNNLGNNGNTVSSLEAVRGTLLFELWYEQALLDKRLSIRAGQLAADQEFMVSTYAALFLNHTFGWSTLPSADLPSGGPAYPLATPGVRVRVTPREDLALLAGVFNGDPAGPGRGLPQERDPSGTAFRTGDGVFAIAEAQYSLNGGEGATGLPGTYKLGAYYDSQPFADQRRNSAGASLADPANQAGSALATGRTRRNDHGLYGTADQLVWRKEGTKDGGVGVFVRLMGAPGDRNLVNFYADAGVTWKGVVPGRDSDTAGIGVGVARTSDTAAQLDKDVRTLTGNPAYPIRRHETVLELTYQAQIAPWWQVQPTFQYLFNLNGGVPNPRDPGKRLGDAAVLGVRTGVTF